MALYQYDYESQNWTQFFFGNPAVDSTFGHLGGLPVLRIDAIATATDPDTLVVSPGYEYEYLSTNFFAFFSAVPQVNDVFIHDDGVTQLRIDTIDTANFLLAVTEVV